MPPSFNLAPQQLHHTTAVQLKSSTTTAPPLLTSIAPPLHPQTPPPKTNPSIDRGCPNPNLLYFLSIWTGRNFLGVRFGAIFAGNEEHEREEKSSSSRGEEGGRAGATPYPAGFGTAPAETRLSPSPGPKAAGPALLACMLSRRLPTPSFRHPPSRNMRFRPRP